MSRPPCLWDPRIRGEPPGIESRVGIADGLVIAAQLARDVRGRFTPGTRQQNLRTAKHERLRRTEPSRQLGALGVRHGTHVYRSLHTPEHNLHPKTLSAGALVQPQTRS